MIALTFTFELQIMVAITGLTSVKWVAVLVDPLEGQPKGARTDVGPNFESEPAKSLSETFVFEVYEADNSCCDFLIDFVMACFADTFGEQISVKLNWKSPAEKLSVQPERRRIRIKGFLSNKTSSIKMFVSMTQ